MLLKVLITGHRNVHDDAGGPTYTVFVIDVFVDGLKHTLERRYSEFEEMHRLLKKEMMVPTFPPKRMLNKSSKFIEERRIQLEAYMQEVMRLGNYTTDLLSFLDIDLDILDDRLGVNDMDSYNGASYGYSAATDNQLTMCPFAKSVSPIDDIFQSRESSPDIILQGLYQALYAT